MAAQKMKAMVATDYGSPEVLMLAQVSKPSPAENEILIRIVASSATTADSMMRTGRPFIGRLFTGIFKPKNPIPGTGFAGIVEKIGSGVSRFTEGQRVFGETTLGFSTNAEYLTLKEDGVVLQMPDQLEFTEAASFCDGHLTSYNFLKVIANIQPNHKVLINGASGALGTAAIQIANYLGAHVTGVCSTKNVSLVKSLGADLVIDYTQTDFTKGRETYDFIFDTVGKSSFRMCKGVLSENGVYLSPVLSFSLLFQMVRTGLAGKKKARFEATGANTDEKLRNQLAEVLEIFKVGKLKTIIDRQFPLEKLAEAHRLIETGHKKGNIIIVNA